MVGIHNDVGDCILRNDNDELERDHCDTGILNGHSFRDIRGSRTNCKLGIQIDVGNSCNYFRRLV